MKSIHNIRSQTCEHIRVRLMRHLLRIGQTAIAESTDIPICATPRIQAYFARERLWVIDLSCNLSPTPSVCKRFICGKTGTSCFATTLPNPSGERFEECDYELCPARNIHHHNHNASNLA